MEIINSRIENNKVAGIRHNPALSAVQQREFAGWFLRVPDLVDLSYNPIVIPYHVQDIELANEETKYIITTKITGDSIQNRIVIKVSLFIKSLSIDIFSYFERNNIIFLFHL